MSRVFFNHASSYVYATLDYNCVIYLTSAIFKAQKVLSVLNVKFYSTIPKTRNRFIVILLDVTRFGYKVTKFNNECVRKFAPDE